MNWHETILKIQSDPSFEKLVQEAYLGSDLCANVALYEQSDEFRAILELFQKVAPEARRIIDIGAGNGISAAALARQGYGVIAIEPDPSEIVGSGAIRHIKKHLQLDHMVVLESSVENIDPSSLPVIDIAFARQTLHHAVDLQLFVHAVFDAIRPGGIFIACRDHVIFDEADKHDFLEHHPLHKYYGGENAFTPDEYEAAFSNAGFESLDILHHFDSVINFAPQSTDEINSIPLGLRERWTTRLGPFAQSKLVGRILKKIYTMSGRPLFDERKVPGRLRTFVLQKPHP